MKARQFTMLVVMMVLAAAAHAEYKAVMLTMTESGIGIIYHATGATNDWVRGNNYSYGSDSVAVVGDVNGNGHLQFVRGRASTTIMYEFDEPGGESFSEVRRPAAPGAYVGVNNGWAIIDLDNNGSMDVFHIRTGMSGGPRLYWTESDGTRDGMIYHHYETGPVKVAAGYLDGSPYGDLFKIFPDKVEWHKGNGPTSTEYVMQWNETGIQDVAVGDFDGDGNSDLFMVTADGYIDWYKAAGIKQSPTFIDTFGDGNARCLIVGDIDQDGTPQLIVGRTGTHALMSYQSAGIGEIGAGIDLGFASGVSDLAWAAVVPEPTSIFLFGLAGTVLLRHRKKR